MGDPSSRISKQHLTTYDQRKDTPNFPIKTHQLPNPQFRNLIKNYPPTLLTPLLAKNLLNGNQSVPTGPPYISTPDETPSQEDPHLTPQSGSPNPPQKVLPARIVRSSSNSYSSLTWKWNGTNDYSCKTFYYVSNIC